MPKPNIIYIHSHDTGRYVQPYGHNIPTPNIQKLAEQGVLFRQAFCAAPTCSPSRACLLTGQWAHCNGMIGLAHRGSKLHNYNNLLPHILKANGYNTALSGMQHVASRNQEQEKLKEQLGYEQFLEPQNPKGDSQEERTIAAKNYIENNAKSNKPFFLDLGFNLTHRTSKQNQKAADGVQWFNGDDSPIGDSRYCKPPAPLPDTPETRQDMADFKESARKLDKHVGTIIDAVDSGGIAGNTLIINTTDHGIAFPNMKCSLTDHGIGVSLIMRGPAGFNGGKVIDDMVSQIDIFPTICEIANIDKPNWLDGQSILPLITGERQEINDFIFAEVNYHAAYEPKRCVRSKRYKYIRRWKDNKKNTDGPVLPNCDDSISKNLWLQNEWEKQVQEKEQLYDLIFDPHETNNLAGNNNIQGILDIMRDILSKWMNDTDDPLLTGYVKPWGGQLTNNQNGTSPREQAIAL